MNPIHLAPSILAADFTRLGDQVQEACSAGVTYIHIDVMDGRFVPPISFGALVVEALRPIADRYHALLDVHLMVVEPDHLLPEFARAGADILTVHVESCPHLHRTVQMIRELGVRPGVTLNPATPLVALEDILPEVDLVLIMSVNPGFGGQSYIPASTRKIERLRHMLDAIGSSADLEVDGGVKLHNVGEIVAAGANVIVAGSAVFGGARPVPENVAAFHDVFKVQSLAP